MNLKIDRLDGADRCIEVVERKGLGHPDTICDALAERLSVTLCRYYLERFGTILHHNVDKALLVGGAARAELGGGEVLAPIEIHLAGRAVTRVGDAVVPVEELAVESARSWLRENLRALDVERHVRIHCHLRSGSADLGQLFARGQRAGGWLANDTSYGVGFAPLSALERLVLEVEQQLDSTSFRDARPESGEDVKVMASRDGEAVRITVARAFIGRHLSTVSEYLDAKEHVRQVVEARARQLGPNVEVAVNASDDPDAGSLYLTVTGTSAEAGDDGEVGRGNRVNGLITPYRPMSLEAAAGKNPVSHVGKLYNLVARAAAMRLVEQVAQIEYAEVFLLSRIGRPVAEPELCHVRLVARDAGDPGALESRVGEVVRDELAGLDRLWERVVRGELSIY